MYGSYSFHFRPWWGWDFDFLFRHVIVCSLVEDEVLIRSSCLICDGSSFVYLFFFFFLLKMMPLKHFTLRTVPVVKICTVASL